MKGNLVLLVVLAAVLAVTVPALAGKPADPGNQGNGGNGNPGGNGNGNGNSGGNGNDSPSDNGQGQGSRSQTSSTPPAPPQDPPAEDNDGTNGHGGGDGNDGGNGNGGDTGNGNGASSNNGQGQGSRSPDSSLPPANPQDPPASDPPQTGEDQGDSASAPGQHEPSAPADGSQDAAAAPQPGRSAAAHAGIAARRNDDASETAQFAQSSNTSPDVAVATTGRPEQASAGNPSPVAVAHAADSALTVNHGAAGNVLTWSSPDAAAGQVQVWRRDASGWTPIALASGEGVTIDPTGTFESEYRLTWSSEPLGLEALAAVSWGLVPVQADAAGAHMGRWVLALLWGSIAVVGLVRNGGPRRVLESRVSDAHEILPLLAGVPGLDLASLERVAARGLRTVGDLRRLDPAALAFWAQVPVETVRGWQQAIELLQWPALPPGAAQRLALAGHASLARIASLVPSDLLQTLRSSLDVVGPGLPADETEVAGWVSEARQSLGLPPATASPTNPASSSPTAATV